MVNHKRIVLIISILSILIGQPTFERLATGGNKTNGIILFNPSWGPDSRTFTVEKSNNDFANKITTLKICRLDDSYQLTMKDVFSDEQNNSWSRKQRVSRYYERNAGWFNYKDEDQLFITVSNPEFDLSVAIVNNYPNELELESDDIERMLDPLPGFLSGEPVFFSTSNDRFYFVSLSSDNEIFFSNSIDEGLDNIYSVGLKDKEFITLPIRSIAVTPDNSDLLFVTYSEALSEIYNIKINFSDDAISFNEPVKINKPDSTLNYITCLRDHNIHSRYILVGSNSELDTKNTAYAFIMNNNEIEGKFLFYRHKEDNASYISPEIQFHPQTNVIYFLKPSNGNEKILSYWDGSSVQETNMDLKNIRDFKISSDGERLLVVTFEPKDLYIYKINK